MYSFHVQLRLNADCVYYRLASLLESSQWHSSENIITRKYTVNALLAVSRTYVNVTTGDHLGAMFTARLGWLTSRVTMTAHCPRRHTCMCVSFPWIKCLHCMVSRRLCYVALLGLYRHGDHNRYFTLGQPSRAVTSLRCSHNLYPIEFQLLDFDPTSGFTNAIVQKPGGDIKKKNKIGRTI